MRRDDALISASPIRQLDCSFVCTGLHPEHTHRHRFFFQTAQQRSDMMMVMGAHSPFSNRAF